MNRLFIGIFFITFCSLQCQAIGETDERFNKFLSSIDKTACQLIRENRDKIQNHIRVAYKEDALFRTGTNALGAGLALSLVGMCLDGKNSCKQFIKYISEDESSTTILKSLTKDHLKGVTAIVTTGVGGISAGIGALLLIHYGIEKVIEDDLDRELKEQKRQR